VLKFNKLGRLFKKPGKVMKRILSFILLLISTFTFAAEDSMYDFSWLDKDKEVYVLQNRKFRKKGNVYIGGTVGRSVSGAFIDSSELNLLGGFFFSEDWGVEFSYTNADGSLNKTGDSVLAQGSVPFYRKIDTATSAMLLWSPFYSKINTFNKIFYYDWMFGAGFVSAVTQDNRKEFFGGSSADEITEESTSGVAWMTAVRFYISPSWSTRIDFRGTHINADFQVTASDSEKRWSNYYNFNIGLNYTF
jgi:outer membrane beta-barrel protein